MTQAQTRISLWGRPYKVSAYLLGTKKEGQHQEKEFYYVPAQSRIFSRSRVNFPYGNNAGDCAWREAELKGDPTLWNHPAQTEELLPSGTKILPEPEEVLLEISPKLGKAWGVKI